MSLTAQDKSIKIIEDILDSMGIAAVCEINEETSTVEINSHDHALLIGKKGENLRALQYIFNTIRRKQVPDSEFLALDVEGYKKERIEKVKRIAEEAAAEVLAYDRVKELPAMNAFERRQVHMVLADNPDLVTESVGLEPHRTIVIKKRK